MAGSKSISNEDALPRFEPLHRFIASEAAPEKLLLAHYTSVPVMESIFQTNQIWFSNPLFMNDLQELRFGMLEGQRLFSDPARLTTAGGNDQRAKLLHQAFMIYFRQFDERVSLDTYVFCLSEHAKNDTDGLLSMWRGYGQHGNGVAIVFDPEKVAAVPTSPLVFCKVNYRTNQAQTAELTAMLDAWAQLTLSMGLADNQLHVASFAAFWYIKYYALISKHVGFSEEREWRVIYFPERDPTGLLTQYFAYHVGKRGVEPKLKYTIGHIAGVSAPNLALDNLVEKIILGPSISHFLSKKSIERMLQKLNRVSLIPRLHSSSIPLRPTEGTSF